jgi:HupE/UreJ protein
VSGHRQSAAARRSSAWLKSVSLVNQAWLILHNQAGLGRLTLLSPGLQPWAVPAIGTGLSIIILAVLSATSALAHDRTVSYSTWEMHARRAQVTLRLSELDVTRFPWAADGNVDQALGAYVTQHLQLLAGDDACTVSDGPRRLAAAPGRLVFEWSLACPPTGNLRIESGLLLDVAPSHLHFVRLRRDGSEPLERVLSDSERSWPLADPSAADTTPSRGTSLGGYVALGIEHIWTGYDHLAFLLALLLIGSSLAEVAQIVTGFTVAHSLTLALAVLGYVRPERAPIEALIGLSIALVAAENVWLAGGRQRLMPWLAAGLLAALAALAERGHGRVPALTLAGLALFSVCYFSLVERVSRPALLRWAIAFVFGLVHGFGFAAVLVEANLSSDRLVRALFGFNAGVEIGQLIVVGLTWPLLRYAWRAAGGGRHRTLVEVASAAVFALGVFLFVTRAYG